MAKHDNLIYSIFRWNISVFRKGSNFLINFTNMFALTSVTSKQEGEHFLLLLANERGGNALWNKQNQLFIEMTSVWQYYTSNQKQIRWANLKVRNKSRVTTCNSFLLPGFTNFFLQNDGHVFYICFMMQIWKWNPLNVHIYKSQILVRQNLSIL